MIVRVVLLMLLPKLEDIAKSTDSCSIIALTLVRLFNNYYYKLHYMKFTLAVKILTDKFLVDLFIT